MSPSCRKCPDGGVKPLRDGEQHPLILRARLLRNLRFMRRVRGWRRFSAALLPSHLDGAFEVRNGCRAFAGNLNSFIDREIYLMGGYEDDLIAAFLECIRPGRKGTILDIGANVGTHSVAFSQVFDQVHAFEPNRMLWPSFEKNVAINSLPNVSLHRIGLGVTRGSVPFYSIAKNNYGLGTVLPIQQYDLPLQQIGVIDIEVGDEIVEKQIGERIDAIKIDVQGFEWQVLKGLERTLRKDRPVLWVEVGEGSPAARSPRKLLRQLFTGSLDLLRFQYVRRGLINRQVLLPAAGDSDEWCLGDYVVVPR